jgi:Flp pilus assembly protein TadG
MLAFFRARLLPFRTRRREGGAAAVEFALVIPLFLVLVMGAVDYGYYFFAEQVVTNAAREGARAGTLVPIAGSAATGAEQATATANARTAAQTYLGKGGVTCAGGSTTATVATVNLSPAIQVVITCPYAGLTGFNRSVLPTRISALAAMRWY